MSPEYIIVNKTAIQKRIEELERQMQEHVKHAQKTGDYDSQFEDRLDELKQILSQSTPLIPEIEKAFQQGVLFCQSPLENINLKNHITNLKLDI